MTIRRDQSEWGSCVRVPAQYAERDIIIYLFFHYHLFNVSETCISCL